MPNGRPGDHALTDITVHGIRTYSRRACSLVRRLHALVSPALLWKLLYLPIREGGVIRISGSKKQLSIREFEGMLARLLESAEALAGEFKTAEREIRKVRPARRRHP